MRLLFDLSPADKAAFEAASAGERILYCLPFDCRHDKRVDGRMVFTDKAIYKVIDAEVEARYLAALPADARPPEPPQPPGQEQQPEPPQLQA